MHDSTVTSRERWKRIQELDGTRIDAYCELGKLGIPERLQLFQQVCAAVQSAPVQRDINPSSILVTADGKVRVLDCESDELLEPHWTDGIDRIARAHECVLTREYASPERLRGERVAAVSDVYSLGVVLYELLTGLRPFVLLGRTLKESEHVIRTIQPQPPSVAVKQRSRPGSSARALSRALAGDLDSIILRAMHKEPERRYASAAALAEDIQNFLDARPVLAHPSSWTYRLGKLVRRSYRTLNRTGRETLAYARAPSAEDSYAA